MIDHYYDHRFEACLAAGRPRDEAALAVTEAYLDGKPAGRSKKSITAAQRHTAFWQSEFINTLAADVYQSEAFILALVRYFGQERTANVALIAHIAKVAPDAIRRAVRYSGLVLRPASARWLEVSRLADGHSPALVELVRIGQILQQAHAQRVAVVEALRVELDGLTPLELLCYASLYAFEHLVPQKLVPESPGSDDRSGTQAAWDAINGCLAWKLTTCDDAALSMTEAAIAKSIATHLSPFLFPSPHAPQWRGDVYAAFTDLVAAQSELNEFLHRSVDAFCFDDSIRFQVNGDGLEIVDCDPVTGSAWAHNGGKLDRLHAYWFYRALDAATTAGVAATQVGRLEHDELNCIALVNAMRTKLRLTEVYGVGEAVRTETGLTAEVSQVLMTSEMMTAFFQQAFMRPYAAHLAQSGNWRTALARLAMEGLGEPVPQIRFPITWSDRDAKITNFVGWTVSAAYPHGRRQAAEAIVDFWSNDLTALASQLRNGVPAMMPELHELPLLKIGRYLFQLPWLAAMQNNATAAINVLRRIGARRAEAGEETRRIEQRLAGQLEQRGFAVCMNYLPAVDSGDDPGEVDVICASDGHVLILEVKSTYLRRSLKDAWLHRTTTLRKAGRQLRRKVAAVTAAIETDAALATALGLMASVPVRRVSAWIVDTSIEHDHERFSGYLKVSLEEVLIALRDDRHLLHDPAGLFTNRHAAMESAACVGAANGTTLYPHGFSADRFVTVVEQAEVWPPELRGHVG